MVLVGYTEYFNDIPIGNSLIGIEGHEEFCRVIDLRIQHLRQFLQRDRLLLVVASGCLEVEVFIDNHACCRLDRRLLLALRQKDLDGIGRHHRARNHKEN